MKVKEITALIENFAPLTWQEEWDNSGLQVGDPEAQVNGILLTLDVTPESIEIAIEQGITLIISHHPLIFGSLKSVTPATPEGRIITKAIIAGISIYSCHTNIDNAPAGVNHRLARMIGLADVKTLIPVAETEVGSGCIGNLPKTLTPDQLTGLLKERLGLKIIRTNKSSVKSIRTVALCGGSGSAMLAGAISRGADAFITADLKYHNFGDAPDDILLADIGHFESEVQVLKIFYELITEKFPKFAGLTEFADSNHVIYYL